jgi:hypothetical protein
MIPAREESILDAFRRLSTYTNHRISVALNRGNKNSLRIDILIRTMFICEPLQAASHALDLSIKPSLYVREGFLNLRGVERAINIIVVGS